MSIAEQRPCCLIMQPVSIVAGQMLGAAGIETAIGDDVPEPGRVRALISRNAPVTAQVMDRFPNLAVIAKHGSGLDAIDLDAARLRGVAVVSTPGANAISVAEHALALMLAVAKRIVPADRAIRGGAFGHKFHAPSTELAGRTLGIVGLGHSGQCLARMVGLGLGMRILAHSPSVPDAIFARCGASRLDLPNLLSVCDVVSVHCPSRPGAPPVIGARELTAMKSGSVLINTARGAVIDEAALVDALRQGRLGGAGLDVFDTEPPLLGNPLLTMDNVVLSPHAAGSTSAALERMARMAAEQVIDVLNGRRPAHPAWAEP